MNNATLTIQKNGESVVTFTANQSRDTLVNIDIPAAPGTLKTDNATAQEVSASEALSGNISLHKVSKTGSYNDLNDKPSIGNGNVTVNMNSNSVGTFTLNQNTDATINLNNVAVTNAANTFTGTNDFTSSTARITVPSKFNIENHPTADAPCTQDAVNICDLWAVFDSLTKRMDQMQETINGLRDSLQNVTPKLSLVADPTAGVICGETPATITYTASITNGNVADYQFKWTVDGTDLADYTGEILSYPYSAGGEKKVICTATRSGYNTLKDSVTITVEMGVVPTFSTTVTNLAVSLNSESDIDSIAWGDGTGVKNPSSFPVPHNYSSSGIVTITVYSTTGCTAETEVTLIAPCTGLSSYNNNEVATGEAGNYTITSVSDVQNHPYKVVGIGSQCWMAENLRSTAYSDPAGKPNLEEMPSVNYINGHAYYGYPNSSQDNVESYGLLYNWDAIMGGSTLERAQGICPDGWHVPSRAEFQTMISSVGAASSSGKLAGGSEWATSSFPSSPGNYDYKPRNSSGFSALPAGSHEKLDPEGFGESARFWTSTYKLHEQPSDILPPQPQYYNLYITYSSNNPNLDNSAYGAESCFSVRCIRNAEGSAPAINPTVTTSSATIGTDGVTLSGEISANGNTISEKGFEWKIVNETVNMAQVTENTFTYLLSYANLSANTYNYRAYAKSNGSTYYGEWEEFVVTPSSLPFTCGTSKMIDASGNSYETVSIGEQCWTKTNLRTTKKRNGDNLNLGGLESSEDFAYYFKPFYSTDWRVKSGFGGSEVVPFSSYNDSIFGYYYNWPAAGGEGDSSICPEGWHVPSSDDWNTLISFSSSKESYYSCDNNPNHIAKALSGITYWKSTTEECTPGASTETNNVSGFSSVPAGYTDLNSDYEYSFYDAGYVAEFWTATQYYDNGIDDNVGRFVRILWQEGHVDVSGYYKDTGRSIRCVRNSESGGGGTTQTDPTVNTSEASIVGETSATLNGTVNDNDNTITAQGFEWKAKGCGTYTSVSATGETMTYTLSGLAAGTEYTYRAFATTAAGTVRGDDITFKTTFTCGTSKAKDASSITYNTVQIGNQCWMAENLRSTLYCDGTQITEKYAYNDVSSNVNTYGYLYTWTAVMNGESASSTNPNVQGICPAGWHVPSQSECNTMLNSVSSVSNFFSPLSGGWMSGDYSGENTTTYLWTSTPASQGESCVLRNMMNFYSDYSDAPTNDRYSVRCVRNAESGGGGTTQTDPTVTTESATNITSESATLNATISNDGEVAISAKGFEYKETSSTGDYTTFTGTITETDNGFSANLTGLTSNTSYTYRAFIKIDGGNTTVTSDVEKTFTTAQTAATATSPTGNFSVNKVQSGVIRVLVENINFQGANSKKVKVYYTNSMNVDDLAIDYWDCFGTFNRDNDDDFSCDITLPSSYVSDDIDVFVKVILESDEIENDLGREQIYPF